MKKFTFVLFVLVSFSLFAQEVRVKVISRVQGEMYDLGIGSQVELNFKNENETRDALFLGRLVSQDEHTEEFMFLDLERTRVLMINPENLSGFKKSNTQTIIRPIDQLGGTCAAYAFFHYWNQMYNVGYQGNAELMSIMSSDRKRLQFLEQAIDLYYLQNKTNITTMMKNYGKRFGFKCKNNPFTDSKEAVNFIFNKTSEGKPVLLDYNIGSDMMTSTYEVIDYENPTTPDPRLWIPRRIGDREHGGHVIVAAAAFISKGRKKIIVIDSDWTEPRVWDLAKYLSKKTAVKEMGFHTCN